MTDVKLASIKLISGEEIICYVIDIIESDHYSTILIRDPMKIEYVEGRRKLKSSYKLVPWFLFANTREHEIDLSKIMGISKVENEELRVESTTHFHAQLEPSIHHYKTNSEGYVGSVTEFRELLEKIYKISENFERPGDTQ
jgi:hypothetical protein